MAEKTGTILIVDDQADAARMVGAVLETGGHNVGHADSAAAALTDLEARQPDLILLDLHMPGMGGLEACKALRSRLPRDFPIIFLTAEDKVATVRACLEAGGDDYVVKGSPRVVLEKVESWLDRADRLNFDVLRARTLASLEDVLPAAPER